MICARSGLLLCAPSNGVVEMHRKVDASRCFM
jgi:hypothetical protein